LRQRGFPAMRAAEPPDNRQAGVKSILPDAYL
jgi:hypothetical protein